MIRRIALVYGYQALRYLVPLLMIAGLSRWLTKHDLAVVLVCQSVATIASQVIEYGFGLAGSRDVAANDGREGRSRTVSGILSAQLLLAAVGALSVLLLVLCSPMLRERLQVLPPILMGTVALGFGPGWYFQGTDRVRLSVTFEGLGQCLALGLLFAVLMAKGSPVLCVWALYLGPLIATSLAWRKIRGELHLSLGRSMAVDMLRNNFALFLARASVTSYTAASTWLMTLLADPFQTATYGAALRVLTGASTVFTPLVQVMLPYVVRAQRAVASTFKLQSLGFGLFAAGVSAGVLVYVSSDLIGGVVLHNPASAPVIRILAFTLPFISLSQFFGVYVLVPRRGDKFVAWATALGAATTLAAAWLLVPPQGAGGMAWARLLGEIGITGVTLFGAVRAVNWTFGAAARRAQPAARVDSPPLGRTAEHQEVG